MTSIVDRLSNRIVITRSALSPRERLPFLDDHDLISRIHLTVSVRVGIFDDHGFTLEDS